MLLITHRRGNGTYLAFVVRGRLYDCHDLHPELPETAEAFIANWERYKPLALFVNNELLENASRFPLDAIEIDTAEEVVKLVWPGM